MTLVFEFGVRQINKAHEELCGDSVALSVKPRFATLVLSDGLGSGVKASILSTLTTRIAQRMLDEGLPLGEVVQTVSATLPICRVRKIAYSTFAIAQLFAEGYVKLVTFDSPPPLLIRGGRLQQLGCERRRLSDKVIHDYSCSLLAGDWLVLVTDGVLNAGIGGAYPLGWGWDSLGGYLETHVHEELSAEGLAEKITDVVCHLYEGRPGDDVTVVAVKTRRKRVVALLAGPPVDPADDSKAVEAWSRVAGHRVVCGGTTANIAARELGRAVDVELHTATEQVPATGRIEGVDLVTEGTLTLTKALEIIRSGEPEAQLRLRVDGASRLAALLTGADEVRVFAGRAINPAHQNPNLPRQLGLKIQLIEALVNHLKSCGKEVYLEYL